MGRVFIMKNLFFIVLISFAMLNVATAQSKLAEPVPGKDVFIEANSTISGSESKIRIDLGRVSRRCKGFGICIRKPKTESSDVVTTLEGEGTSDAFAIIYLAKEFDDTTFDTNLYIDEDLKCTDDNFIIAQNIYRLDKSIGKFGGYKIAIK